MNSWTLLLVLLILATYRLTRLIAVDAWPPIAGPRERYSARHEGTWITYLWNCPFCVSVHVAAFVTFWSWLVLELGDSPGLPLPILWWGAVAGSVGLIYEILDRLPDA